MCDRVVVLQSGEKIAEGTSEEVLHDDRVIDAYLGKRYRALLNSSQQAVSGRN